MGEHVSAIPHEVAYYLCVASEEIDRFFPKILNVQAPITSNVSPSASNERTTSAAEDPIASSTPAKIFGIGDLLRTLWGRW